MTIRWNKELGEAEKRCNKCGEYWPVSAEFWFLQNGQPNSPCKGCQQENRYTTNAVKPCCVPGCTAPRAVTKSGIYRYSRCANHQKMKYQETRDRQRSSA